MQVTIKKFLKDFESIIGQQQMNMGTQLAKGQCKDMEEYKRIVGRVEGMSLAVQTTKDMITQLQEAEENEALPEMPQA